MSLSKERQEEIALPINRARYHLGSGVPEADINPALIGKSVIENEIPDVIALAKERNASDLINLTQMIRRGAYGYMAAGAGFLLFVQFAMSTGTPSGFFRGRALVCTLVGAGLLAYGFWRWAFPTPSKLMGFSRLPSSSALKPKRVPALTLEQAEIVRNALWVLLRPQVTHLGYEQGSVPIGPEFVTEKCRGYLFGLCAGVLNDRGLLAISQEASLEVFIGACQMVYGDAGRQIAVASLQDTASPAFRAASEFAIEEVRQISAWVHHGDAAGFYLYKIGQLT